MDNIHSDYAHNIYRNTKHRITTVYGITNEKIYFSSDDHTLRIAEIKLNQLGTNKLIEMVGHQDTINGFGTIDNQIGITWSNDCTIRLWDVSTGTPLKVLQGHTAPVIGCTRLEEDKIISWSTDNTLRTWDSQTGKTLAVLEGHTAAVTGALPKKDGRIISWSADNTIRIWKRDEDEVEQLHCLSGHTAKVNGVLLLDESTALSWSNDHTLRLWDINTGLLTKILTGHVEPVVSARLTNHGQIYSIALDGRVCTWSKETGEIISRIECLKASIMRSKFLKSGNIVTGAIDGILRIWKNDSSGLIKEMAAHSKYISFIHEFDDGTLISASKDEYKICLWNQDNGDLIEKITGFNEVLVNPEKKHIFACWLSGETTSHKEIWITKNINKKSETKIVKLNSSVKNIKWINATIIEITTDSDIYTYDTSNDLLMIFKGHTPRIRDAYRKPPNQMISWADDMILRSWDTNKCFVDLGTKEETERNIFTNRNKYDEEFLFIHSKNNETIIFKKDSVFKNDTGKYLGKTKGIHWFVAISLQEHQEDQHQLLVTIKKDFRIQVWNIETGEEICINNGFYPTHIEEQLINTMEELVTWYYTTPLTHTIGAPRNFGSQQMFFREYSELLPIKIETIYQAGEVTANLVKDGCIRHSLNTNHKVSMVADDAELSGDELIIGGWCFNWREGKTISFDSEFNRYSMNTSRHFRSNIKNIGLSAKDDKDNSCSITVFEKKSNNIISQAPVILGRPINKNTLNEQELYAKDDWTSLDLLREPGNWSRKHVSDVIYSDETFIITSLEDEIAFFNTYTGELVQLIPFPEQLVAHFLIDCDTIALICKTRIQMMTIKGEFTQPHAIKPEYKIYEAKRVEKNIILINSNEGYDLFDLSSNAIIKTFKFHGSEIAVQISDEIKETVLCSQRTTLMPTNPLLSDKQTAYWISEQAEILAVFDLEIHTTSNNKEVKTLHLYSGNKEIMPPTSHQSH